METVTIKGKAAMICPQDGPRLGSEQDALDLVGATYGQDIELIVIPVQRLDADFFTLGNGKLGAFLQKLTNYCQRVAFVGDLGAQLEASKSLRDFVREADASGSVRFVDDLAALERL